VADLEQQKGYLFCTNHGTEPGNCTQSILSGRFLRASTRLQLRPALQAAQTLDDASWVLSLQDAPHKLLAELGQPRACLFSKLISQDPLRQYQLATTALAVAARMKAKGVPLVLMYSDHHAAEAGVAADLMRDLLRLADLTVFPSRSLQAITQASGYCQSEQTVIEDVCLLPAQPFRPLVAEETLQLIWFGHRSNAGYLVDQLPLLLQAKVTQPVQLTVLTEAALLPKLKPLLQQQPTPKNWRYRLKAWDPHNQPAQLSGELNNAHICWLPSDPQNPRKAGASHNRLVDALTSGCLSLASPLGSYRELAAITLLGDRFDQLLTQAVREHERMIQRCTSQRDALLQRFQPNANHSRWRKILQRLASRTAA